MAVNEGAMVRWVNQTLSAGGHADVITDLSDMGDGITLLKLVQTLAKENLPKHSPVPLMRAEKLENLQVCLSFLRQQHILLDGVHAEDFLAGRLDSIMAACKAVRNHFSSNAPSRQRALQFSTIEKEDVRVLMWLAEVLRREELPDYTVLYDGAILCRLMNVIHTGAISDLDLENATTGVERLKLVESASRKYLYMTYVFDPLQVSSGSQDGKLRSFLQQCKQIYQQQQHRHGAKEKERLPVSGGKRESREAAHVSARSYDAMQKKKTKDQSSREQPASAGPTKKKYSSELYVQGASSVTDLSSRRTQHQHMIRGGVANRASFSRHSSTSSESLDHELFTTFGGLDRVHSMESGISQHQITPWKVQTQDQSATLPRSASQDNLPPSFPAPRPPLGKSLARSTESFHTQTFGSGATRRTPSYLQLSSTGSEDFSEQLHKLEEGIGVLASRFLYERRDMFKQILHALVKERRKRQLAERRIEALEKNSRQLVQHYDQRLIELAKQVTALKSQVALQQGTVSPNLFATELEELKEQLSALTENQQQPVKELPNHLSGSSPVPVAAHPTTVFLRKRGDLTGGVATSPTVLTAYSKGPATSYKKLSRFFGEAPPRVEDLESLCEELGYTALLPKLRAHNVTLAELCTLTEEHLEAIGIPLGARVRLLEEVKKLVPIDGGKLRYPKISDFTNTSC